MQAKNTSKHEPLKLLLFAATLRSDSLNNTLAKLAEKILLKHNCKVDFARMNEFDAPSFNQEEEHDFPKGITEFRNRLLANDAFIIASPEYNGSMPGYLKNTIDWASRFRPQPFNEKHALIMSASPSMAGGNKGLWQLRMPLEHLGTDVFPSMFSLAMAHKTFDENGNIADASLAQRFENTLVSFIQLVEATKHYPCMKHAWVEFLGEKTDSVTERIE
ncbi:MAG: NAD(P)H-dependent oxidoreductase [Bacteroidia bacterium]|nr:NAD(P)H-dependent oxidoreductase [Bacteroidia bacterium]MCZ2248295.1 NAD(P)H-dependent oxidoreductase [Bacteroidia bacterium]